MINQNYLFHIFVTKNRLQMQKKLLEVAVLYSEFFLAYQVHALGPGV